MEFINRVSHSPFFFPGSMARKLRPLTVSELLATGLRNRMSFYHRAGFRAISIDKDFFVKNYREPIYENGIQHKDMLRLAIEF